MSKDFNFSMLNKSIKIKYIDVVFSNIVIPKESKGIIIWKDGKKIETEWLIGEEKVKCYIPIDEFNILFEKKIIEILEVERLTDKPLYKKGDLIKDKYNITKGIIKKFNYNIVEKQYEYAVIIIEGDIEEKFKIETLLEKDISLTTKIKSELYFEGLEYEIILKQLY